MMKIWKKLNMKKDKIKEKGIIFFDIDGVLNIESDWKMKTYSFRPELVKNLCLLAKEENCDLVMISSWRTGFYKSLSPDNLENVRLLEEEMQKHGIIISAATPVYKGKSRDLEIERYLSRFPTNRYIIIDDDKEEYLKLSDHNLFVDSKKGFNTSCYHLAKKYLN